MNLKLLKTEDVGRTGTGLTIREFTYVIIETDRIVKVHVASSASRMCRETASGAPAFRDAA
jgi:hypothetical protein